MKLTYLNVLVVEKLSDEGVIFVDKNWGALLVLVGVFALLGQVRLVDGLQLQRHRLVFFFGRGWLRRFHFLAGVLGDRSRWARLGRARRPCLVSLCLSPPRCTHKR